MFFQQTTGHSIAVMFKGGGAVKKSCNSSRVCVMILTEVSLLQYGNTLL